MSGVNKVMILGHLGRDPELRYLQSGVPVCALNVATSRRYTNKDGVVVEETEWHRIKAWAKLAETCNNFLSKGRQVHVEGRLKTTSYDKDGQKHYTTEIVAESVQFIGPSGQRQEVDANEPPPPRAAQPARAAQPVRSAYQPARAAQSARPQQQQPAPEPDYPGFDGPAPDFGGGPDDELAF
ncbi:MAG: single-stranded DNA-binding protein [Myxococcales bacterium]|nr:single-stranded DNA-binding protein [Myxococcales bacterium]